MIPFGNETVTLVRRVESTGADGRTAVTYTTERLYSLLDPSRRLRYNLFHLETVLAWRKHMEKARRQANGITEGVIWRQLLAFFFPIMLGTLFQQLYNTVDAVVVSRFVGTEALASVGGSAAQILNLLIGFFVGLSSGAAVIVSQFYGARDDAGVSRAVHTAMTLAIGAGLLMTAAGLLLAPVLLSWMNTPADTLNDSAAYMRIVFLGMVPSMLYNAGSGVLRAVGDSRRPLYFLIAACLTNVVLDLLFVAVLRWRVVGVAVATVSAQVISAVLTCRCLTRTRDCYRVEPGRLRPDRELLQRTLRIGLPAGMTSVMYALSNMIITATINSFGTDTVAAWVALGKVDGLFWMIDGAFGLALMTFVGQNYGARKPDRVRRGIVVCMWLALAAAFMFSTAFFSLARPIFGIFIREETVMAVALQMMRGITPFYFLFIPIEMLGSALRGMGTTLKPTIITACGICLFRVVWMLAVVPGWHTIPAITVSYPISWLLTSAAFIVFWLRTSGNYLGPRPSKRRRAN